MQDEEILKLFLQRDETAIEQARLKYGAYCLRVAAGILKSREDCEECLNEALSRAWDAIPTGRPESLKLYLATVTRNIAFDQYRKSAAQKRGGAEVTLALEELSECVRATETPEDVLAAKELGRDIDRFLETLPQRERNVFLRRYFFTENAREIAARYRLGEAHVHVILSRTRKKLRTYLRQEGYFV